MEAFSLSKEEFEYLRTLVLSDVETRETKGPMQYVAKDVYDLIVEKYLYQRRNV